MLLALLVINIVVIAADPFHKYPYVFLLDVGNEEIEGTNTEQVRVTIPGGSLALKYPAVETGDTISHVRVSGVDFGKDLKAEIVEGGPGYKYVVLVFMGNPGVAYDAVVTIETVSNQSIDRSIDESNDSAEDTNDYVTKDETVEIDPFSSNIYINNDGAKNDYQVVEDNVDDAGEEQTEEDDGKGDNENENEYSDEPEKQKYLERQRYEKYQSFRPQLYGGARVYPQASLYVEDNNFKPVYDPENHAADDSSGNIYLDSNNNVNSDSNSVSADY